MAKKENGTVSIHGKEYETVGYRVQKFREDTKYKDYAILTHLVSRDDDTVVMKATILDGNDRAVATGFAEENRRATMINKTSALENCETSAIGRALAALGMGGTEYATADEVANAIGQQGNKPKSSPDKQSTPKTNTGKVSAKQINFIMSLLSDLGASTTEEKKELFTEISGHSSMKELTSKQATEAIDELKKQTSNEDKDIDLSEEPFDE